MARVLVRDAHRKVVPLCRGPELREQLVHVDHAHRELRLLQVRAAARGVDHDRVDVAERPGQAGRAAAAFVEPSGVEMERTAALLRARRDHLAALRGEHTRRRGVDVAEDHPLDAAEQEADPQSPDADRGGHLQRQLRRAPRRLQVGERRQRARQPGRRQRERQPQPARVRDGREDQRPPEGVVVFAVVVVLDVRTRLLDQAVVADP
jgi:hypothetical protein